MATHLAHEWGWGLLSAPEVQKLAHLALQDELSILQRFGLSPDASSASLRALAGLGGSGRYPGNMQRDLVRILGEPSLPKPFMAPIHMKIQKPRRGESGVQQVRFPFLLPHEYFAHLYQNQREVFTDPFLGGDSTRPSSFWTGALARRDPRLRHHWMVTMPDWQQKALPISFHGDVVPCIAIGKAGTKSLDVWSWQSVLTCMGTSLDQKLLSCCIFNDSKCKSPEHEHDTEAEMGEVLLWSVRQLSLGEWPSHDHRGVAYDPVSAEGMLANSSLAGGYFCVLWLIKGDLDYVANYLHCRHYASNQPCDLCPCDKSRQAGWWPSNFGTTSSWMSRLYSPADWRALYPTLPHWLFKLNNVNNLNIEPDELHIMYLGTSMYLLGSTLWLLVFRTMGGDVAANMSRLWEEVSIAYSTLALPVQLSNLTLSSFCDPQRPRKHYPKLKGKGAEVKGFAEVMRLVWARHCAADNAQHQLITAALDHQCHVQRIIDNFSTELFLPQGEAAALRGHIQSLLTAYTQLGHIADTNGDLLWNMVPKFHCLWHFGERAQYLCPRRGACLVDEDFVGKQKIVAQSCSAGTALHSIPHKVVEKDRWGKNFRHQMCA